MGKCGRKHDCKRCDHCGTEKHRYLINVMVCRDCGSCIENMFTRREKRVQAPILMLWPGGKLA